MNKWRVIFTDSEGPTGFAPVCPDQNDRTKHTTGFEGEADEMGVYDCCPEPHIECWSASAAERIVHLLNACGAEFCS